MIKSDHHIDRNKRPGCLIFRKNKETFQNRPKAIGFVYSPLWKITVFDGRLFRVGICFGKHGTFTLNSAEPIELNNLNEINDKWMHLNGMNWTYFLKLH